MRNVLIEITALDSASLNTVVLRGCAKHATPAESYLDGKEWLPVITGGPEFEFSLWDGDQPGSLDITYGAVSILLSAQSGSLAWPSYSFDGADATIWVGEMGSPFAAYRKIFTGKLGPIDRTSDQTANLPLLGPESVLNKPILSDTYGGTGGADGTTDIMGTWKPYAIGACTNVAPVLIDPIKWVYQVDGYDACAINAVYEMAYPIGAASATVSTYAELIALTIPKGQWAAAPAVGMFRLANEPTGKITADIGTPSTAGAISSALMLRAGISSARIDASVGNTSRAYNLYINDQASVIDVVRAAAFAGGRYMIANGEGKFYFAPLASTKPTNPLNADRSVSPLVALDRIAQDKPSSPAYKVRIGHTRVWAKHSSNEISPALKQVAANQDALDARAQAAQNAADDAKAQADLALNRYNAMVADGILDRSEKRTVIERFEGYTAELPGILSEASNQAITTERTAYNNAYTALNNYLTNLAPAYNDTTQDTAIVANDFKAAFVNYDVAKENLRNAIANKSAKTANWTNVASRPTDLTGLNASEGTKLGGIATGADVTSQNTSKDTAAVGGTPAATVIGAIKDSAGNIVGAQVLKDGIAAAATAAQTARTEAAAVRTDLQPTIAAAQTEATTARNEAAAVRSDLVPTITAAKAEGTQARTDLAAEVDAARKAEGVLSTRISTAQQTADGASSAITTETTQRVAGITALTNRTNTLESKSASNGAINLNPTFAAYTNATGPADGWGGDDQTNGGASRVAGETGGYALQTASTAAKSCYSCTALPAIAPNTWWVVEADVKLTAGTFAGAGILFRNGTQDFNISFVTEKDTTDTVVGAGTIGQTYRFRKLVQSTVSAASPVLYYMTHYSAFGSIAAANTLVWYRCAVRPASNAEIAAQKADTALNAPSTGVIARLTLEETTRASGVSGVANRATALETSVNNSTTGLSATYSKITTEETTRAAKDEALNGRLNTIESTVNTPGTGVLARITAEETTRATQTDALVNRTSTLETTTNAGPNNSVNANPYFTSWPNANGLPTGWVAWNSAGTVQRTNSESGIAGTNGLQFTASASGQLGVAQPVPLATGWYVIEADVWLGSGSWNASGVTIGGVYNLSFATDPDSNGTVSATALGRRKFSKLANITAASDATNFHPMANWDGFGSPAAKQIVFYRCSFRAASDAEIKGMKADASLNQPVTGVVARLTKEESTRATDVAAVATRATNLETAINNGTTGLGATYAKISTEETTRATAIQNLANRAYTLETRAGNSSGYTTANPYFAAWPDGVVLPSQWQQWNAGTYSRELSSYTSGGYMLGHIVPSTADSGLFTTWYASAGYWVLEASIYVSEGSLQGAGIYVDNLPSLNFSTVADSNGGIGAGGPGIRNFSLMVQATASAYVNFYAMGNWSAFGATTAKKIHWLRAGVRPASDGEVKAMKADAALNAPGSGVIARLGTEETARATAVSGVANRATNLETAINNSTTGLSATYAKVVAEETARSSAVNSVVSRTNTLETRFGNASNYLNANPTFAAWQDGQAYPAQWGPWYSANISREGSSFTAGAYMAYHNLGATDGGFCTTIYITPGYWVYECSIWCSTGTLQGAGLYVDNLPALNFSTVPDTGGYTGAGGTGIRNWAYMVNNPSYGGQVNLYAMTNWSNFGTITGKTVHWLKVGIRPASNAEVLAFKADASLNGAGGVVARITSEESARASAVDSITTRINSIESNVNTNNTGVNTRIGNEETARANAVSALTNRTSTLESGFTKLNANPNIMPPLNDWTGAGAFYNSQYWGPIFQWNGNAPDQEQQFGGSPRVYLAPSTVYTISADLLGYGGASVYSSMDVIVYDANNNVVQDTPNTPACTNQDFNDARAIGTYSATFTTPANASYGIVRLLGNARNSGNAVIGCRKVKLEKGYVATIYSDEAAVTTVNAAIKSEATTRASQTDSLATRTASLEGSVFTGGTGLIARMGTEENARATAVNAVVSRTNALEASVKTGGNLLASSVFNGGSSAGWGFATSHPSIQGGINMAGDSWHPVGEDALSMMQPNTDGSLYSYWYSALFAVTVGQTYQFSCYVASHRADAGIGLETWQANGTQIVGSTQPVRISRGSNANGGQNLAGWDLVYFNYIADQPLMKMSLFKWGTNNPNSDSYAWFVRPQVCAVANGNAPIVPYAPASGTATIANALARVSVTEGAISTLNGRARAFWEVQSVAGNNRAQLTVRADANGGAGIDIVGDVNFSGNLNIGPDSGRRTKITNSNTQVFDANGVRRVAWGLDF